MDTTNRKKQLILRILNLIIGLAITSWGTQTMITASIGLNPRGILVQGIMHQTDLSYGTIVVLLGISLIVLSAIFRRFPGIGTICNVALLGPLVDLYACIPIWQTPDTLLMKILLFLFGLAIFSFGMSIYLSQELGAGPRDGIMMLLIQMPRGSVVKARTILDAFSAIVGYLLGGPVGAGSILAVALSGVMLKQCFRIIHKNPKCFHQENILETLRSIHTKTA